MKLLPFLMLSALTLTPSLALSQDEQTYVVTGSRFATPMNQIGYNVTVFTEEELQEKQLTTLDEVLRLVPGVSIFEYGTGNASAFFRGAKSNAILVLIDGVAVNDPISTSIDVNSIAVGNAERVEILLGAQSAMYGSGALAGVINIITKEGNGSLNGSVYLEGGYPANGKLQASVNGSSDKLAYSLGLTGRYSNAISATNPNNAYNYNDDIDPFFDVNLNGLVKYTANEVFNVSVSLNETLQDYAYDEGPVDGDTSGKVLRSLVSVRPELNLIDGFWNQSLNLSYLNTQRSYGSSEENTADYNSQGLRADWQHRLTFDRQNVALGVVYNLDQQIENTSLYTANNNKINLSNVAGYAEYSINPFNELYINLSGRADQYSSIDYLGLSGSAAVAYTLPTQTLLQASIGRGFRAPNVHEYAYNDKIEPETSFVWDLGVVQPITELAEVSISYYQASYTNFIIGTWNLSAPGQYVYSNSDTERTSNGITASLSINPIDVLTLALSGNYEMSDDGSGSRPPNVPDYTASFDADYTLPFGNNAKAGFTVSHVGDRNNSATVLLDPYTLVNLRAQADVMDNLTLYLKLNNILNTEYEERSGYSTLGINGNIGVKYTF